MSTNTLNRMPVTYQDLAKALDANLDERVTIANNTTAEWSPDGSPTIVVRLHGHAIVQLWLDGDVQIRHCGWVTTTTFDRLNRFTKPLGYRCFRHGGQALVEGPQGLDTIEASLWTTCFA